MWTESYLWCNRAVFNNHFCFISMWVYFSQELYVTGIQSWLGSRTTAFFPPFRMFPILECMLINADRIYCSGCLLHVCNINQKRCLKEMTSTLTLPLWSWDNLSFVILKEICHYMSTYSQHWVKVCKPFCGFSHCYCLNH